MKQRLVTLIDSVGRYIIGEFVSETETSISLKTPIILNIQPDQSSGRLHIQNFPLFFKEFLLPDSRNVWTYAKSAVVIGELDLDTRLVTQYETMTNPQQVKKPEETPVIKLFEE